MSYSIVDYQRMFQDRPRHDAYVEALTRSIKPGDVVIEVGTGFGVYAILAAKLGASKVYAIETNELVRLGPALAEANGVGDKIEFFEMMSTEFVPPQQADVVFADMRGSTPLYGLNVESMHDAAIRFLKPGGVLIPSHDVMEAAVISLPASCGELFSGWDDNPMGFNLGAVRDVELSTLRSDAVAPGDLLSASEVVHTARFGVDEAGQFDRRWETVVTRTDLAAGFALWFTGHLVDGITVGPAPDRKPTVYKGSTCLFKEPLPVVEGDVLECHMQARKRANNVEWLWEMSKQGASNSAVDRRVNSTMMSVVFTPSVLGLLHDDRTVLLTNDLAVDHLMLELLASGITVGQVVDQLLHRYPEVVGTRSAAKAKVTAAANRYQRLGRV